jgi:HrpA-like RNA helicase/predicted RNA-binding protein YlqC (UPF0109 family)
MDNVVTRGIVSTGVWQAGCKDCAAERQASGNETVNAAFEYSDDWARRTTERGNSRSDRCERHRREHRRNIQSLAVAYVDLQTIGDVADRSHPTGPLGGLGPLPIEHSKVTHQSDLAPYAFGMKDSDILDLLSGLKHRRVAVIEAGTGTGKSTFMPFRLMTPPAGAPLRLTEYGPIIVTEPRKAAAIGVATFVGETLCFGHDSRTCANHIGPGFPVGYQVSGDKHWDSACQLVYVTDGTMINWVRDGSLATIGTVIVDEAHERSENIDIILAQLCAQLERYPHLRVIITSATLDKDFFIEYFGGPDRVHHQYIAPQKSFGYGVPFFLELDVSDTLIAKGLALSLGQDPKPGEPVERFDGWSQALVPSATGLPGEDILAITRTLASLPRPKRLPMEEWQKCMPAAVAEQVVTIALGTHAGDILAFLPTTVAINEALTLIRAGLDSQAKDFDVYPLLASTPASIRDQALEARNPGARRKIVISSNLAETSLTVKGVRYVVDSGLICQPEWDPELATESFPTKPHSRSGVRQRWGRVGRDAPGWVFPLYSIEQYMSLPRDTPPGSTQTNLETFSMKLLSAGLDLDRVVLPANFSHPNIVRDDSANQACQLFSKELIRARSALKSSGAIDADGHLTDYGRDLDRFPGSGSRAIAIMLADQLACVHEVAFALAILGDGRLVGGDDGLFRFNREWPASWRVHATRCHRALAMGCIDDLELVLRVGSEWQASSDRKRYCDTWWLDSQALVNAFVSVEQTLLTLSPAMKSQALRMLNPALANRARAVLTRAMGGHRYERVEGKVFKRPEDDIEQAVCLDRSSLTDAGTNSIIALSRFRLPPERSGSERLPIVANTVAIIPWALCDDADVHNQGVELAATIAAHTSRDALGAVSSRSDILRYVRELYPIGTLADLGPLPENEGEAAEPHLTNPTQPFLFPGDKARSQRADTSSRDSIHTLRAASGFDANWDPYAHGEAEEPPEEVEQRLFDLRGMETNDHDSPQRVDYRSMPSSYALVTKLQTVPEPRIVVLCPKDFDRSLAHRAEVIGYTIIDEGSVGVVVDLYAPGLSRAYLDMHSDLDFWDEVQLEARGPVPDHIGDCFAFVRCDRRGTVFLTGEGTGVDVYDREFPRRFHVGSRLAARVIPDTANDDHITVTFVEVARTHLDAAAPYNDSASVDPNSRFLLATVVESLNQWNRFVVELDHRDSGSGLSHRFDVRGGLVSRYRGVTFEVGQRILVGLGVDDSSRQRRRLSVPSPLPKNVADRFARTLRIDNNQISFLTTPISRAVADDLLSLEKAQGWSRDVWRFVVASYHLSAVQVKPIPIHAHLEIPKALAGYVLSRLTGICRERNVSIVCDTSQTHVRVTGFSQGDVDNAIGDVSAIIELPYVIGRLPPLSAGKVIGQSGRTIKQLQSMTDVLSVAVDDDTLMVIGKTATAVNEVVSHVRSLTTSVVGTMTVPDGKAGLLIGRGGETIKQLRTATGCWAQNENRGPTWSIEGPSRAAVEAFFQMAAEIVSGTSTRIVESRALTILHDSTKPKRSKRVSPDASSQSVSGAVKAALAAGRIMATSALKQNAVTEPLQANTSERIAPESNGIFARFMRYLRGSR